MFVSQLKPLPRHCLASSWKPYRAGSRSARKHSEQGEGAKADNLLPAPQRLPINSPYLAGRSLYKQLIFKEKVIASLCQGGRLRDFDHENLLARRIIQKM
jgi:hypothetical protein